MCIISFILIRGRYSQHICVSRTHEYVLHELYRHICASRTSSSFGAGTTNTYMLHELYHRTCASRTLLSRTLLCQDICASQTPLSSGAGTPNTYVFHELFYHELNFVRTHVLDGLYHYPGHVLSTHVFHELYLRIRASRTLLSRTQLYQHLCASQNPLSSGASTANTHVLDDTFVFDELYHCIHTSQTLSIQMCSPNSVIQIWRTRPSKCHEPYSDKKYPPHTCVLRTLSSHTARKAPWNPVGVEPVHRKPADINPGSLKWVQIRNAR